MKLHHFLILLLTTHHVFAETNEVCKMQEDTPEIIAYLQDDPSYFAKVSADGNYVFYISEGHNYILDLKHGGSRVKVPGPYDPVPTPPIGPDRKVRHFTVPSPNLEFYSLDEALTKLQAGKTTEAKINPLSSFDAKGAYQSIV